MNRHANETPEEGAARLARLQDKLRRIHSGEMGINKQGQVVPLTEYPDAVPFPKDSLPQPRTDIRI